MRALMRSMRASIRSTIGGTGVPSPDSLPGRSARMRALRAGSRSAAARAARGNAAIST